MLIHKGILKLSGACSTDVTRYALSHVSVWPDGSGRATDGHMLLEAKPFEPGDSKEYPVIEGIDVTYLPSGPILISREDIIDAQRMVPKVLRHTLPILANNMVLANGDGKMKLATTDLRSPSIKYLESLDDTQFPDTEKLWPNKRKPKAEVGLGVDLLLRMLKTVQGMGVKSLKFTIYDSTGSVKIESTVGGYDGVAVRGLLMPMRLGDIPKWEKIGIPTPSHVCKTVISNHPDRKCPDCETEITEKTEPYDACGNCNYVFGVKAPEDCLACIDEAAVEAEKRAAAEEINPDELLTEIREFLDLPAMKDLAPIIQADARELLAKIAKYRGETLPDPESAAVNYPEEADSNEDIEAEGDIADDSRP